MNNQEILKILKTDLQISVDAYNVYLENLIELARAAIEKEGIMLDDTSVNHGMLVEMYAAFLYRKRREEQASMPRSLRYALNNELFSQKGRRKSDG